MRRFARRKALPIWCSGSGNWPLPLPLPLPLPPPLKDGMVKKMKRERESSELTARAIDSALLFRPNHPTAMNRLLAATVVCVAVSTPAFAADLDMTAVNNATFTGKQPASDKISPVTIKMEILLDRAHFSPGEIDGKLGELDSLKQDDILAVRSNGNIDLIGRCILVGEVTEKISHSGFTIRIRLSNGSVLPKYVCHFMKSAGSRKLLTEGGTGTNIKSLNQGMLSTLAPALPETCRASHDIQSSHPIAGAQPGPALSIPPRPKKCAAQHAVAGPAAMPIQMRQNQIPHRT